MTDVPDPSPGSGTTTPAEPDDDFFSSWDKPAIKRPSNPPSRTGTPAGGRTASPFLQAPANGNGSGRPRSPLASPALDAPESATSPAAIPAASKTATSAIRKTGAAGAKKTNILGAKKNKLGAKKVAAADGGVDFEEAERKAREEAERIEKLGYDPDAEAAEATAASKPKAGVAEASNIVAPTPIAPPRGGFGATKKEHSSQEMERLGTGMGRLGFGQVGAVKKEQAPKKMGGFGATSRAGDGRALLSFFIKGPGRLTRCDRRLVQQRCGQVWLAESHLVGRVLWTQCV